MSPLARLWLPALVLMAVCALPSRRLEAGEVPATSDRDRAVAAALEAANLRMRAKIEEAGILDRQGLHDDALAALRTIEGIHREGMVLVARLTATGAGAGARPDPVSRPPLTRPARGPWAPPKRPVFPGISDAVSFLLRQQRADGWFGRDAIDDPAKGDVFVAARDLPTTAFAVLALVDAATLAESYEARALQIDAIRRGVGALLGTQVAAGAFGEAKDLESHALASWAVAAGVSILGRGTFDPDVRAALDRASAFSLGHRDERGLWRAGTGSRDDDWVVSAYMEASLFERADLPRRADGATDHDGDMATAGGEDAAADPDREVATDLDGEVVRMERRARAAAAAESGDGLSPAARYARAMLLSIMDDSVATMGGDALEDALPATSDGETTLLLGTTHRFGRGGGAVEWRADVLLPEQRRQHHDGPLAGSWDPVDARAKAHGRTYATACQMLSALIPLVPYREPEGD